MDGIGSRHAVDNGSPESSITIRRPSRRSRRSHRSHRSARPCRLLCGSRSLRFRLGLPFRSNPHSQRLEGRSNATAATAGAVQHQGQCWKASNGPTAETLWKVLATTSTLTPSECDY